ncbi:MAG: carbohydrate ABC transporter permease [Acidimicrobiia bacterium]|jgi:sn-glycerol 3-phosphate transport system permease protein
MPGDTAIADRVPDDSEVAPEERDRVTPAIRIAVRYALLTALAAVILFPLYITVVNSLLKPDQIASRPPLLFPTDPQWDTYSRAWDQGHLGRYLLNSFVVTGIIVAAQLVTSIFAAYAFAFLEFPFRRTLFFVFLATLMVPFEVVFFTNFNTVSDLGLYNTYAGLALPFLATGFGAFLIRQAFLTTPGDLRDAAQLDGYGHWRFMWRVAVPLARPAVGALAVFSFLAAWGEYLWPLIITADPEYRTVQVGLRQLSRTSIDQINVTFAGIVLASAPLFVLLIVFQKQLVRGLTAGAVKG